MFARKVVLPASLLDRTDVLEADLGREWLTIHFLLTGTADKTDSPLGFIVSGGTYIGDEDIGYEPARALSPGEVKTFDQAVSPITDIELRARISPEELRRADVTQLAGDPQWEEDLFYHFHQLQNFLAEASRLDQGAIVTYT